MKITIFSKKFKAIVLGIALLSSGFVFSQIMHEAENCEYTGNSADYCYASDGQNNLKVINCKPGETACYY